MPTRTNPALTLRISGKRITHDRFLKAAQSFFGVLSEVSEEVTGEERAVDWIVSVEKGSIVLGAAAEETSSSVPVGRIVDAAYEGLRTLLSPGESNLQCPEFFNDRALQEARDLSKLVDGKGVETIQIRRRQERFEIQGDSASKISSLLGGTLFELGTIEGRLEMISSRGGLHCGVWDTLENRRIRCNLDPATVEIAKQAFRKRVLVTGKIRLRPTGEPASIDAEKIEIFSEERLPTADEVYGILTAAG